MSGSLEVRCLVHSTTSQVAPLCLETPLASKHRSGPFGDSHLTLIASVFQSRRLGDVSPILAKTKTLIKMT
jgi:hypothetical protein